MSIIKFVVFCVAAGERWNKLSAAEKQQLEASLAQFEAAMTALTLPDLDGNGDTELTTNPYSTATSAASTFVLDTN